MTEIWTIGLFLLSADKGFTFGTSGSHAQPFITVMSPLSSQLSMPPTGKADAGPKQF